MANQPENQNKSAIEKVEKAKLSVKPEIDFSIVLTNADNAIAGTRYAFHAVGDIFFIAPAPANSKDTFSPGENISIDRLFRSVLGVTPSPAFQKRYCVEKVLPLDCVEAFPIKQELANALNIPIEYRVGCVQSVYNSYQVSLRINLAEGNDKKSIGKIISIFSDDAKKLAEGAVSNPQFRTPENLRFLPHNTNKKIGRI